MAFKDTVTIKDKVLTSLIILLVVYIFNSYTLEMFSFTKKKKIKRRAIKKNKKENVFKNVDDINKEKEDIDKLMNDLFNKDHEDYDEFVKIHNKLYNKIKKYNSDLADYNVTATTYFKPDRYPVPEEHKEAVKTYIEDIRKNLDLNRWDYIPGITDDNNQLRNLRNILF